MTQSCQIVKNQNKKGSMGLTDFFSILTYALFLIVFYLMLKLSIGSVPFELTTQISKVENYVSALSILRTQVTVDVKDINIAELIALSNTDQTKKVFLEKTIVQIMDDSFGTSRCAIICINGKEIKGNGCGSLQSYVCSNDVISIPSYEGKPIGIYFEANIEPTDLQLMP